MKKILSKLGKMNLSDRLKLHRFKNGFIISVALAVFVAGNILMSPFALKLDLSKGRAYSLSAPSRKILKNLKDKVTIKLFLSSDIPTRLIPLKSDVTDFLNEYKKTNAQKIDVIVADPKKDTKAAEEAKAAGVPELQFSQLESDKYALSTFYFGVVISAKDKREIIPQVADSESLEYNLTSAIYKLTNTNLAKVAVLGRAETFDPQSEVLANLLKLLRQQYEVIFPEKADSSAKAILVFDDGFKKYSDEETAAFKKYIDGKGKIIFFADGVWVGQGMTTEPAGHNLFNLFHSYGITLDQNLVLSGDSELVSFAGGSVSFFLPYPFWLKTNNFNTKSAYFSNVSQLTFPWTSSVTPVRDFKNSEIVSLVSTTDRSWDEKLASGSAIILDPQNIREPLQKELAPRKLITEVRTKNGGELVVVPSSRFVLDNFLGRGSNNLDFVLNLVNNFASGGALSGINQRAVSFYPLPSLPPAGQQIFKYANILLLPALFALYGLKKLLKK